MSAHCGDITSSKWWPGLDIMHSEGSIFTPPPPHLRTPSPPGSTISAHCGDIAKEGGRSRDYVQLLCNNVRGEQYHRQHHTLQVFAQFGALNMHTIDDKIQFGWNWNQVPLGFEPQPDRVSPQSWVDLTPVTQSTWWQASTSYNSVNTRWVYNAGLMLAQRRRRWANIKPTLVEYTMLA